MENKKTVGIVLLVVGIIVLALSLLADSIGIGGSSGLGYKQIVGAAVGVVVIGAGLVVTFRER